jgi:hypothetical protein
MLLPLHDSVHDAELNAANQAFVLASPPLRLSREQEKSSARGNPSTTQAIDA